MTILVCEHRFRGRRHFLFIGRPFNPHRALRLLKRFCGAANPSLAKRDWTA